MLGRLAFGALFLAAFWLVNEYVPWPYMDEIFHVPQTLQYISERDFSTWDPKITTPPGLYYLGFVSSFVTGKGLASLRSVNLAALFVLLVTQPLEVASFPLLAFYANLYYTDVWSTLLVLAAFSRKNPADWKATSLFFASLWFRQTNVIWLGLAAAFSILEPYTVRDLTRFSVLQNCAKSAFTVVSPLVYVVGAFCVAFLKINGGITLGDKTNHQVAIHGAQLLYFLLFLGVFSAPLAVKWVLRQGLRRLYLVPLELAVILYIVRCGTIVHPFILADNRHYTFYIWRRVITPLNGLAVTPVYWAAWRWFASTLRFERATTWVFLGAVIAVLVPTPLMEPRYYIVPYLVWRRFMYKQRASALELCWNAMILAATVAVFCFSETHFMW